MSPKSSEQRKVAAVPGERYRASGSVSLEYVKRLSGGQRAIRPVFPENAADSLRHHFVRALLRVLVLAVADVGAFLALRQVMRLLRIMPAGVGEYVNARVPLGFLVQHHFGEALLLSLVLVGAYKPGDHRRDLRRILVASAIAACVPLWAQLFSAPQVTIAAFLVIFGAMAFVIGAVRLLVDRLLRQLRPHEHSRVILVGPGAECLAMLGNRDFCEREAFHVLGFLDSTNAKSDIPEFRESLTRMLADQRADTLLVCGSLGEEVLDATVKSAMVAECQVLTNSRILERYRVHPQVVWRNGRPFVELRAPAMRLQQLIVKRVVDVAIAGVALLLLAPVMGLLALAVRLSSPGPAVFGQVRLGQYGRRFRCFKFRSMYVDAEQRLRADQRLYDLYVANDYKLPADLDMRVTPVGRFLRRTSLDELPQLWNVLRGDMSLVGPRPIVPDELRHYEADGSMLLVAKPGITGHWQVNGRSDVAYPERANLELDYVHRWSLMDDLRILLRTVPAVLLQRGAH